MRVNLNNGRRRVPRRFLSLNFLIDLLGVPFASGRTSVIDATRAQSSLLICLDEADMVVETHALGPTVLATYRPTTGVAMLTIQSRSATRPFRQTRSYLLE